MQQLSKIKSIIYHLYPGIIVTACFVLITPVLVAHQYPPQLGLLLSIPLAAIPILLIHLFIAKKQEHQTSLWQLNGYTKRLSTGKLVLYAIGLVLFAFLVWGITQPIDELVTEKVFSWLPAWYIIQDFKGYSGETIQFTLVLNLLLNGFIAPFIEEFYFRGYLLPRMQSWGKAAFVLNAVCFSLYHLWQPYVYITLIISLLPMTYLVWKTKDIRLGILTHCLLNIVGALLSFGLLMKK